MILAPVIQPACIVLRVHLECEAKEATSEVRTELDPFPTLTPALIALPSDSLPMAHGVHTSFAGRRF